MNGKTMEEIYDERMEVCKKLNISTEDVLDTVFADYAVAKPIDLLGRSISKMADADIVVFTEGWINAKGCKVEYQTAMEYLKPIINLHGLAAAAKQREEQEKENK